MRVAHPAQDARVRAPASRRPRCSAAMDATIKEIDATMTLVDTNGLPPTGVAGARIVSTGGRSTVLDGPFTESRELIGGYAIVEVDTFQQAVDAAPEDHRGAREVLAGLGGRGRGRARSSGADEAATGR